MSSIAEQIKDLYFKRGDARASKVRIITEIVSILKEQDKAELKEEMIAEVKKIISEELSNGNAFPTEVTPETTTQYPVALLENFRSAILKEEFIFNDRFWECPKSFKKVVENMSLDELNRFYDQCYKSQQSAIADYLPQSTDMEKMLYEYYNRDLISNIEILVPLLDYGMAFRMGRDVIGGVSFWGRKNHSISQNVQKDILNTIGFYKNFLIMLENGVWADPRTGFLNIDHYCSEQQKQELLDCLKEDKPNIFETQNEYIIGDFLANGMIGDGKYLDETINIDENTRYEIYYDSYKFRVFVMQYKTTPNNFANRINNKTNATKCEIALFYLPDNTIKSAFQLARLDMYSEDNVHKPYGLNKVVTRAHIHLYSMEDAALNKDFDKEKREKCLAHYDKFINLPKLAAYEEYESYFKHVCGIESIKRSEKFYHEDEPKQ